MSNKANRQIEEALGVLHSGVNLAPVSISLSSTSASGVLASNTTYRLAADQDCYVVFQGNSLGTGIPRHRTASSGDTPMFGGVPEVFSTDENNVCLTAVRKSTDGTLVATPLKTRKQ